MIFSSTWNNKVFSQVWKKSGGPPPVPVGPLYIIPGSEPFGSPSGIYSYSTDFSSWTNAVLPGYSTSNMEDCHTDGKAVYSIISPPDVDQELGYTKDGTNWTFDDSKIFSWLSSSGGLCMVEAQDTDLDPSKVYIVDDGVLTEPTTPPGNILGAIGNYGTEYYFVGFDGPTSVFAISNDKGDNWTLATNPLQAATVLTALSGSIILAEAAGDGSIAMSYSLDKGATAWVSSTPFAGTYIILDGCTVGTRHFYLGTTDDFSASYIYRTTDPSLGWSSNRFPTSFGVLGVRLANINNTLVLTLSDPADGFTSYYTTSTDAAATWTTPVKLFDNVPALRPSGFEQYFV